MNRTSIYLLIAVGVVVAFHAGRAGDEVLSIKKPKVLIIGDSISIGYTPPLKELLADKAEVLHNPGNAEHSKKGVEKINEWLGDTQWAVIHFNHGLHDLKWVDKEGKNIRNRDEGRIQIPLDEYRKNLETIVERLKETGAVVIFATTTPFPDEPSGPLREAFQVGLYNQAALEVMHRHGVIVNDLHAFALPRLESIQQPNNVHFTREGSVELAKVTAGTILKALEGNPLNR